MAQTNDLTGLDPDNEQAIRGFDYGFIISSMPNSGITLTSATVTLSVVQGTDSTPQDRLLSPVNIITSPNTGLQSAATSFLLGNMVSGTTYQVTCLAATSDGQDLSLWALLACPSFP